MARPDVGITNKMSDGGSAYAAPCTVQNVQCSIKCLEGSGLPSSVDEEVCTTLPFDVHRTNNSAMESDLTNACDTVGASVLNRIASRAIQMRSVFRFAILTMLAIIAQWLIKTRLRAPRGQNVLVL